MSFLIVIQEDEDYADTEALLAADFEIGHFIRERIVPRAVLYYTGEALDDDFDEECAEEVIERLCHGRAQGRHYLAQNRQDNSNLDGITKYI